MNTGRPETHKPLTIRGLYLIGVTGFEPATSWSRTKRSTKLSYTPDNFQSIVLATCRRGDRSTKLSYTPAVPPSPAAG